MIRMKPVKQIQIDEVKARVNLVDVLNRVLPMQQETSTQYLGVCPFHDDTKPSLRAYTDTQKYYCFTCGAKGDVVDFVRNYYKKNTREALELLDNDFCGAVEPVQTTPKKAKGVEPQQVEQIITKGELLEYVQLFENSGLYQYAKIKGVFDLSRLLSISKAYRIGQFERYEKQPVFRRVNTTTFPFYWLNPSNINETPKVVNLEFIGYDKSGKRASLDYVSSIKGGRKGLGCIGLHLLHPMATDKMPVYKINIVESGKTALLMQAIDENKDHIFNGTLWLATGGTNFLDHVLKTLQGFNIMDLKISVYPDADAYTNWLKLCELYGVTCINILELGATGKEDIFDVTIRNILTSRVKDAPLEQATILRPHRHKRKIQDKERSIRINAIKTAIKQQNDVNDTNGANDGFLTPYA